MRIKKINHRFVSSVPENTEEGVLYVSTTYRTAIHKCCCGCGNEIVTPLSPTDWSLIFDGVSITLTPSIGNWSLPCKAHYLIEHNSVIWAGQMSARAIATIREQDRDLKDRYYAQKTSLEVKSQSLPDMTLNNTKKKFWSRFSKWLS